MPLSRLTTLILFCCMAIQGSTSLLTSSRRISSLQPPPPDQFPSDGSGLPTPFEGPEVEWELSDGDDDTFCLIAIPFDSNSSLADMPRDGSHSAFTTSSELLSTLHRYRI